MTGVPIWEKGKDVPIDDHIPAIVCKDTPIESRRFSGKGFDNGQGNCISRGIQRNRPHIIASNFLEYRDVRDNNRRPGQAGFQNRQPESLLGAEKEESIGERVQLADSSAVEVVTQIFSQKYNFRLQAELAPERA